MSGDVERPPAWLEGREHRNGKWKKCTDYKKGGKEIGRGGVEQTRRKWSGKMDETRIRSPSCIARWNLPRSRYRDERGRWSNFPGSRAENDPDRDYETASSLRRGRRRRRFCRSLFVSTCRVLRPRTRCCQLPLQMENDILRVRRVTSWLGENFLEIASQWWEYCKRKRCCSRWNVLFPWKLKRTLILILENDTLISLESLFLSSSSYTSIIYSVSQDKRKMHEASCNSWTGSVVATMRCPFVASRVADLTINIMRQKT